jgi:hypothetical protein
VVWENKPTGVRSLGLHGHVVRRKIAITLIDSPIVAKKRRNLSSNQHPTDCTFR